MSIFWSYFWPPLGAGLLVGILAGAMSFRRRRIPVFPLAIGVLAAIALAVLWHGPLGAADRYTTDVERSVRQAIVYWEIPQVSGHLHRAPLTRTVDLSGPADDFQRSELVRIIDEVPGVESATWSSGAGVPLIVEGSAAAIMGFLLGLLVAYLRELRRRYNAQWNW